MTPTIHSLEALRASAGSGKTYALTTRYLSRLLEGAPVDAILATTFTRKAAGEILGRVLKRLAEAALEPGRAAELRRALEVPGLDQATFRRALVQLCQGLHRVSISTIDSYFNRLAQSFRHELGLPAELRLLEADSPASVRLRLEGIRAVLATAERDLLLNLLSMLEKGRARRPVTETLDGLVASLYEVFLQAPLEAWSRLQPEGGLSDAQLETCILALEAVTVQATDKRLVQAILKAAAQARARDWEGFLTTGLVAKLRAGVDSYYNKPIPVPILEAFQPLIDHSRAEVLREVARQTEATAQLLRAFDDHYRRFKQQAGVVLFSDLPRALAATLPGHPDALVHHRLDARIEHLLLDEFQDTSPEQWTVLRPVAQRIAALEAAPASVFCVGDVKQAIYGWRGGCAEIFDHMGRDLPGLAWRSMARSYRSSQIVLDAVNAVFSSLATNPALERHGETGQAWQEGFERHEAAREGLPGYVALVTGPADLEEEGEEEESAGGGSMHDYVADRVAWLAQQAPRASIGVLTRTNASVQALLFALQKRGVAASGEGGNPLVDDPAVEAVLAALTLADHPGDTVAAFQVRHSPLAGVLGLEGGAAWAAVLGRDGRLERAPGLDEASVRTPGLDEASARGRGTRQVLEVAAEIRQRLLLEGYAAVLADWTRALAPACSARSVQRLTQLVELADGYDAGLTLRPSDFTAYVRGTTVEEPLPARVRVMTIHKSKGLEFDVVVLTELHKQLIRPVTELLIDRPDPTAPIQAVYRYVKKELRELEPGLAEAYRQYEARQLTEGLCGLYVGMTRARYALHLVVSPLQETKSGGAKKEGLSNAAILRGALRPATCQEGFAGLETLYAAGDPAWYSRVPAVLGEDGTTADERASSGAQAAAEGAREASPGAQAAAERAQGGTPDRQAGPELQSRPPGGALIALAPAKGPGRGWRQLTPSSLERDGIVTVADLFASRQSPARLRGSLLHAFFEQLDWIDGPLPDDHALLELGQRQVPGQDAGWYAGWLERFKRMLELPVIRAALSRPAVGAGERLELWKERRFVVRVGRELVRGAFDRVVVVRAAGDDLADPAVPGPAIRAELIDFKTDEVAPGQLDPVIAQYRPQLEAYRQALVQLLGLPPEAVSGRLLFVSAGVEARV